MKMLKRVQEQSTFGRLLMAVVVAVLGIALGHLTGHDQIHALVTSEAYFYGIALLLAIGLYSSTRGIELHHLRADLRTVVLAVTVGVIAKAVLITGVMYALSPRPLSLVLGVAVAQIDPLSVAALQRNSQMSDRGKALLLAWASFDDPVTTLLTIYAATLAMSLGGMTIPPEYGAGGLTGFVFGLAANLLLAGIVLVAWRVIRRWRRSEGLAPFLASCILLIALIAVAVSQFWMLGVAITGLFLRPVLSHARDAFEETIQALTLLAFLLSVLGVGVILSLGVNLAMGLALGLVAFLSQGVVSVFLTRDHTRQDQIALAGAQQNGITAIVLALLLLPSFPEIVGIVAPAVLVVNLLHALTNGVHENWLVLSPAALRASVPRGRQKCSPSESQSITAAEKAEPVPRPPETVPTQPVRIKSTSPVERRMNDAILAANPPRP
jgi:NhaP-type Na+/H+ or K+/H+ antiporter